jgi:hypothetical protein
MRRWKGTVKMDLRKRVRVREIVDWIHLAQYRDLWQAVVNTVMSLKAPQKAEHFLIG